MIFTNMIDLLFKRFPFLEQKYLEEGDYIFGLQHPCYSFVFVPYIREVVENNDIGAIEQICDFFEEMAICADELVSELLVASVLENIVSERNIIATLKKHLKPKTMERLSILEKATGWDSEHE